jgi:hypothetical protein
MRSLVVSLLVATTSVAYAAPDLDAVVKTAPGCDAARASCIGIAMHIAVDGDDKAVATAKWMDGQLEQANKQFEKLDVGFKIVSVDALPSSAVRVENRKERDSFAPQVKGTVIHVFVTAHLDDIDKPGDYIYGVAWRARGDTKFIILSTMAWDRTLAHELGHVFGLPHSSYPISIMNKTDRKDPPIEQRRFDDREITAMKPRIAWMLRSKKLVPVK